MITESRVVDGIIVLRLLKLLAQDVTETDAYKKGIIDRDYKMIKKPSTSDEKDAYSILNRFVFKVKRALMKSPDRYARRLLTVAAALSILKESSEEEVLAMSDNDFETKLDLYEMFDDVKNESILLEHNLVSFKTFRENVSVGGSAGGGGVDGIGVGPKGEPGRDPVMQPLIRRKKKEKEKWPQLNK